MIEHTIELVHPPKSKLGFSVSANKPPRQGWYVYGLIYSACACGRSPCLTHWLIADWHRRHHTSFCSYVHIVQPDSIAARAGLMAGASILEISGANVKSSSKKDIDQLIELAGSKLTMRVEQHVLAALVEGDILIKVRGSNTFTRKFTVSEDGSVLSWISRKRGPRDSVILTPFIRNVR